MVTDKVCSERLDVIVRFHDPGKITELKRATLSLVCQNYAPIVITLATQRFSEESIAKLTSDLAPTLAINPQAHLKIQNFSEPLPLDARSTLLNTGVRQSTGRYLAFLDYDDTIFPQAYCTLISELRSTKCAIAFGSVAMKDADVFEDALLVEKRRATFRGANLIDLLEDNFCPLHSFVIDRKAIDPVDLWFDEGMSMLEDYDFLLRICAKYPASFKLIGNFVGDYYIKNDGTNTLPGEVNMRKDSLRSFRTFDLVIQERKRLYLVSETVQRHLGIVPAVPDLSVAALITSDRI